MKLDQKCIQNIADFVNGQARECHNKYSRKLKPGKAKL
jgi:hypothetical protein